MFAQKQKIKSLEIRVRKWEGSLCLFVSLSLSQLHRSKGPSIRKRMDDWMPLIFGSVRTEYKQLEFSILSD
jgi:hypothetical protein